MPAPTPASSCTFPPQHFREQILVIGNPIGLGAAAPSSIALLVPAGVEELALGPDGLWGLCETLEVGNDVSLAVPARVGLTPLAAHWSLALRPTTVGAGTDLWRARLDRTRADGAIEGRFLIARVDESLEPQWEVLPTQDHLRQRLGGIMTATRFDLSALGGSVRMRGPVEFDPTIVDPAVVSGLIASYVHEIELGRDVHVEVVTHGHLSSGHPATLVEVTNREWIAGPAPITPDGRPQRSSAGLDVSRMILVDDPVLSVEALAAAYGSLDRRMPFRRLRMLTTRAAGLVDIPDAGSFWVRHRDGPLDFAMEGTDWAGGTATFALPLIFIPAGAFDVDQFISILDPTDDALHRAALAGATVTLADTRDRPDAAAAVTVDSAKFSLMPIDAGLFGAVTSAPVLPFVASVGVVLDAVTQFTGTRTTMDATWHDTYADVGLDAHANPLGAYLQLPTAPVVALSMKTDRVGGLARPDMVLGAVTALHGAVPAGFEQGTAPDQATVLAGFAGAKILGVISLTDVIGLDGLAPPVLHTISTPEQVEVRYHWQAPIRDDQATLLKPDGDGASITLDAVTTRRVGDGQTTASVEGLVSNVALDFVGIVRLHFDSLRFRADPGRKAAIVPSGMRLDFANELAFLNDLREALQSVGLADGASVDVTTSRITAGFSAALPTLSCGVFTVTNLSVSALLTIPFDESPVAFRLALAERYAPFGLSYSMFTGGGFFALELDSGGIKRIEAALEFGGSLSLDLVVARGSVYVMAGIYFMYWTPRRATCGSLATCGPAASSMCSASSPSRPTSTCS